jgi:glycosyltransferase involved in cell wall biosynthesis
LRILLLSPYVPSVRATHAGAVSLAHIVGEIASRAEVTLVTLRRPEEEDPTGLEDLCAEVHTVPYGSVRALGAAGRAGLAARRATSWLASRISGRPYFVEKYSLGSLASLLRGLPASGEFDVAQVEFTMMAQYLPCLRARARILDLHEVGILPAYRDYVNRPRGPGGIRRRNEWLRWVRYEVEACRGFDRVLTVTEKDRRVLETYGETRNLQVNPHGIDARDFSPEPEREEPGTIVFVGSFAHAVNVDAVTWFVREILPLVRRERPEARFLIVGSYPPASVRALAEGDRVVVTGFVDRVQDYLARAEVFVAPLRVGGGIKIKVLQALSMERSVVTTPVGADGIDGRDGEHFQVASDPEAFARRVLLALADPTLRKRTGRAGRDLVLERYDWKAIGGRFLGIYKEVLAGKTRGEVRGEAP